MARASGVAGVMLSVVLGLAMLGARFVGAHWSAQPGLALLMVECEDGGAPCWRGIQVGLTSISEARDIVLKAGYAPVTQGYDLSDRVFPYRSDDEIPGCVDLYYGHQSIRTTSVILGCMPVMGGDVLLALGQPLYRVAHGRSGEEWVFDHVIVRLESRWGESPFARVQHVRIVADDRQYHMMGSAWRGMLPRWRYCQLERDYAGCAS